MALYIYAIEYTHILNLGGVRRERVAASHEMPLNPKKDKNIIVERLTVKDNISEVKNGIRNASHTTPEFISAAASAGFAIGEGDIDETDRLKYEKPKKKKGNSMVRVGRSMGIRKSAVIKRRIG
jgi:hypothetical protein